MFKAAVKGAPEGFKPCRVERVRRWSLKRESKVSLFEEVNKLSGFVCFLGGGGGATCIWTVTIEHSPLADEHVFMKLHLCS